MKIQVVRPDTEQVQGYTLVGVETIQADLQPISDNECTEILAGEVLDSYPIGIIGNVISMLLSKLRMNGKIVIGGTDINLFCKAVLDGSLSEQEYCEIIERTKCMTKSSVVVATLRGMGLKVDTCELNGITFQIVARRN